MSIIFYFQIYFPALFQEDEKHSHYQKEKGYEMIPLQSLVLEQQGNYYGEDSQGNHFLDDLELDKIERTAVVGKTYSVGRDLRAIFEKRYAP